MSDHCSQKRSIPQLVPALCLSALFQFAACAQVQPESGAAKQQADARQTKQSVDAAAAPIIDIHDLDFTALSDEMICSPDALPNALSAYQTAYQRQWVAKGPQVQVPPAKVEVAVQPPAHKLHDVNFAEPDKLSKHAPKTFRASAYAIQGRTYSGARTKRGVVAADPRVLPLGTVVQLNAGKYTGVYTVHDVGGAIKGNRLDVWMPSTKEARRFGRRNVKLVVLRYPGQNENEPAAQQ